MKEDDFMNFTNQELMEKYGITYNELLTCRICGKRSTQIGAVHLKTHGITMQEYKEKFPQDVLMIHSIKSKQLTKEKTIERNKSIEQKQIVSNSKKGVLKTEEHKQKLIEAKANEDKELRSKINGDNRRGKLNKKGIIV